MAFQTNEMGDGDIVAEINITPLTDIFLVLLIIFMISSSAMLESGMNVKLPSAKTSNLARPDQAKPIYITVNKQGDILLNEKIIPQQELTPQLQALLAQSQEKTVIIRGDESIFLGKAVQIMDAARNAGAEKIAIATQNKD